MLRIGIVACEASGDLLGASLVEHLRNRLSDVRFEGVAGPGMLAQGCHSLYPLERLSVMGLFEVLRHLPELLRIRRHLRRHFLAKPPDMFVGVDCPDFNLGLERRLREARIKTVHYVSPTVWAWRPGRVRGIARAVDLILSIFPFEERFLREYGLPARYVGHPLADQIPLEPDQAGARTRIGLPAGAEVMAILPGSRVSEIRHLAEPFLEAARRCREQRPGLHFVIPMSGPRMRQAFEACVRRIGGDLPIVTLEGRSRDALEAADIVLTASGTATLEAALFKRPMVVGYRMSRPTYWVLKYLRLVKTPHIAMANLVAGERVVPELIQAECEPDRLSAALLELLDSPQRMEAIRQRFREVHAEMRLDAGARAADAVMELLEGQT